MSAGRASSAMSNISLRSVNFDIVYIVTLFWTRDESLSSMPHAPCNTLYGFDHACGC